VKSQASPCERRTKREHGEGLSAVARKQESQEAAKNLVGPFLIKIDSTDENPNGIIIFLWCTEESTFTMGRM
jgi:hypothetical protein